MTELKPKRRHYLSKKESKSLLAEIRTRLGDLPLTPRKVESVDFGYFKIMIMDSMPCIAIREDLVFPTLRCLLDLGHEWMPHLIVDRGATLALARGAHLMLPGIRGLSGSFNEGDIIAIVDEGTSKAVAVGVALKDSRVIIEAIDSGGKGRAARNIHRPGDIIWKACNLLSQ